MLFLDAALRFKANILEYIIEVRNLLNIDSYNYIAFNEGVNYEHNYSLRPFSFMFKVRFSLGA